MSKLRIRYNGRRFPRIINMSGRRGTLSFTEFTKELLVPNYDANLLLTFNTRLNTGVWEFDIIEVIKDELPKVKSEPVKEEVKPEPIKKPAKRGRKKGA